MELGGGVVFMGGRASRVGETSTGSVRDGTFGVCLVVTGEVIVNRSLSSSTGDEL